MSRTNRAPTKTTPRVEYRTSPSLTHDEARRRRRSAYRLILGIDPWPETKAPKP